MLSEHHSITECGNFRKSELPFHASYTYNEHFIRTPSCTYLCSTTPTVNVPEATDLGTPRYKEQNDSQLCLHA